MQKSYLLLSREVLTMPRNENVFVGNRQNWLNLAEVDYIGPFVKAWLAYNAWYRNVYCTMSKDFEIMEEIKWKSNPIKNTVVPMLESTTEESVRLRNYIGALHSSLESYELRSNGDRITFRKVYIKANSLRHFSETYRNVTYSGTPTSAKVDRGGVRLLNFTHNYFCIDALTSHSDYLTLSEERKRKIKANYEIMNPRISANFLERSEQEAMQMGAYSFYCTADDAFSGMLEIIYQMRCSLFHGELIPEKRAVACYEPAYWIVRSFLDYIS